jgi:ubiquinone biosynthesis protein UbiJ
MLDHAVVAALNHFLDAAHWARERLMAFPGKQATIAMPPLRLAFRVRADGTLEVTDGGPPDVQISLPSNSPLLAVQGTDAIMREAHVSGSAEFADALRFVALNLEWDFEEDLSRIVGDIAAHRIAGFLKTCRQWQRDAAQRAAENLVHYLRDTAPTLVMPTDVETFVDAVDRLRDDLARLEKRIERFPPAAKGVRRAS